MSLKKPAEHYLVTFFRHGCNIALLLALELLSAYLTTGGRTPRYTDIGLGMLIFVVVEYLTHRFAFHAEPVSQPFIRSLQRRLHYDHHRQPKDLGLLFLPLWFGVPAVATYGGLYLLLTRNPTLSACLLFGNLLALLYYEYVHYVAHIPVTPSTPWGQWMKKYHLWHHYKNENYWFGVTNPSMDFVFRTYCTMQQAAKSGTTHDLEGDE
jgi:hypothetical protein